MTGLNRILLTKLLLVLSAAAGVAPALAQNQAPADREIIAVAENLYQARDGGHATVFLVTDAGVILADPLNTSFAQWLKAELAERFNASVQYVLYSHHHWDHASGGAVFADTAMFIGHEAMVAALDRALPLYGPDVSANTIDRNGDDGASRQEVSHVGSLTRAFDRLDTNSNGELSGDEINVDILGPEIVYSDRMKVTLAGQTVELIHSHPTHSEDMTVLHFPEQRAAFAVDFVNARRMPGPLFDFAPENFIRAVSAIYDLDVDVFVPGHGAAGTGQDLADYVGLFRHLQSSVSDGIEHGATLNELQGTIDLSDYTDWLLYEERRGTVIADVYEILRQE